MEKERQMAAPKMRHAPGILGLFAVNAEQAHQGARLVASGAVE
jgi:hypothetical protein